MRIEGGDELVVCVLQEAVCITESCEKFTITTIKHLLGQQDLGELRLR